MSTATPAAGAIYDIGYRSYEGERLGRGYAFRTLFVHSLRSAFGLGRGGRALIIPWALFLFILFPASIQVAFGAFTQGQGDLLDYADYFQFVGMLVALFCAAQAPELVSTDQHNKVLPLYFSRALRKRDYALAKLLAMATAVCILVLTPLLVLLIGRLGMATDFGAALRAESSSFAPILATPLIAAAVLATLSVGLASLTPRRAIGSALVLGAVLLTVAVAGILVDALDGEAGRYGVLVNPLLVVTGAVVNVFGEPLDKDGILAQAALPLGVYLAAVAGYAFAFTGLLLARYRGIRP